MAAVRDTDTPTAAMCYTTINASARTDTKLRFGYRSVRPLSGARESKRPIGNLPVLAVLLAAVRPRLRCNRDLWSCGPGYLGVVATAREAESGEAHAEQR